MVGVETTSGSRVGSGGDVLDGVSFCDTGAPAVGADVDEALHPHNTVNMNSGASNLAIVDPRHQQYQLPTPALQAH
jgi:hypothetical protein